MKDKKKRNSSGRDSQEFRVVRITSNPGPDADDRMRRLISLLIKYATEDGYFTPGRGAPEDGGPANSPTETEASADGQEYGSRDECEGHCGV